MHTRSMGLEGRGKVRLRSMMERELFFSTLRSFPVPSRNPCRFLHPCRIFLQRSSPSHPLLLAQNL